MTAQYHAFLRLMAAQAYMAEGRTDTAYRLFKGLVEDEQNAESTRAFCWICMSQLKRSRQDQQECLAKARTLAEESHSPHLLMVLMLQLQSGGSPEEILPAFRQVAEQADDPRLLGMFGTMLGCSSIDSKEAEKLLKDSYAKILASSAKDPAQHVTDLMWFAAAATEHHPDMALAASKEAEVFAGKMVPGSEQLRLARLCRAKVLQKTGHASEAGPYSDVDTAEEMDVSFNFRQSIKDGVPTLEVQVSVVSAKEGK
jgi:hypothetical protein